jgi:hypothetical protein
MDPFELRLKNANRIGDTRRTGIAYTDPSTVPTIHSIAEAIGHELPGDYRAMTATYGGATCSRAPARAGRGGGSLMAKHVDAGSRDRVSDRDEPERRPVAGVDQDQAGRTRRRLLGNVRHRQRLEDDPEPDRPRRQLGVPYEWITVRQLEHRTRRRSARARSRRARPSSPARRREGGAERQQKLLEIAAKELEIAPDDLEVVDGEVIAKGAPQKKIGVPTSRRRRPGRTAS